MLIVFVKRDNAEGFTFLGYAKDYDEATEIVLKDAWKDIDLTEEAIQEEIADFRIDTKKSLEQYNSGEDFETGNYYYTMAVPQPSQN